jgi:L-serine deaminase
VNAPLIAAERGIEVSEAKRLSSRDFTNLSACGPETRASPARRSEPTRGSGSSRRSASSSRSSWRRACCFLRYDDVPGVIGRVGTALGRAGVNIAQMAVSRNNEGGKALMALSVDSPASPELLVELREGMDDAFVIQLRGED